MYAVRENSISFYVLFSRIITFESPTYMVRENSVCIIHVIFNVIHHLFKREVISRAILLKRTWLFKIIIFIHQNKKLNIKYPKTVRISKMLRTPVSYITLSLTAY